VFQIATIWSKFSALQGIAEAKKERRGRGRTTGRWQGIGNAVELAAAENKGSGTQWRLSGRAPRRPKTASWLPDSSTARSPIDALRNGESGTGV